MRLGSVCLSNCANKLVVVYSLCLLRARVRSSSAEALVRDALCFKRQHQIVAVRSVIGFRSLNSAIASSAILCVL